MDFYAKISGENHKSSGQCLDFVRPVIGYVATIALRI